MTDLATLGYVAMVGGSAGLGAEIGLIIAAFGFDFDARIKSDVSIRRRALLWLTVFPGYALRRFEPDVLPALKMTALFVGVGAIGAVVLALLAIGALEVIG